MLLLEVGPLNEPRLFENELHLCGDKRCHLCVWWLMTLVLLLLPDRWSWTSLTWFLLALTGPHLSHLVWAVVVCLCVRVCVISYLVIPTLCLCSQVISLDSFWFLLKGKIVQPCKCLLKLCLSHLCIDLNWGYMVYRWWLAFCVSVGEICS